VSPDDLHPMTRVDVLEDNRDLLDHAGRLLAALPVRALTVEAGRDPGGIRVDLQATNLDRVALWVDGEPRTSLDVSSGIGTVVIGDVPGARVLRVDGYSEGVLAAGRTIDLGPLEVLAPAEGADGGPRVAAPTRGVGASGSAGGPTVIYVHGAGNKPPRDQLTKQWDRDLFGRDMSGRTVMAYYADLLYAHPEAVPQDASTLAEAISLLAAGGASADGASSLDVNGSALDSNGSSRIDVAAGLDPDLLEQLTPEGRQLALSLAVTIAAGSASAAVQDPTALVDGILPFPWLRQILLRQLLQRLIPDANAYFLTAKKEPMRQRLRDVIDGHPGRLVVVSHSLGTAIAYDVLSEPRFAGRDVRLLTTLGCPLGYTEIQDVVTKPLAVPKPVRQWVNAADPLDVVCLDTTLSDDFHGQSRIIDVQVDNPSPDNHAPGGYLSAPQVRAAVSAVVSAVRA
ncbi:MAG TPA: hypothetical protein VHN80_30045, partial [Kineosporiaceae bacterium]|nr:hypothetical protein [Kineosporiaceae bacterium]